MRALRRYSLGRGIRVAGVVAAAAVALAACGGGGGSSAAGGSGGSAGSGSTAASGSATVATSSGDMGTYLTDASGKTLYLWDADKQDKSTCKGRCLTFWPPLLTKGEPKTSGDAKASLLGTTARSDGSKQVTYAGHPLYYYASDSSAGDINGQGNTDLGPKWWIVAPSGTAIMKATGGGSSPSESSGGGAGGGWA